MKKILFIFLSIVFLGANVFAMTKKPVQSRDIDNLPQPRISIFSTSTDWEGLTGLLFHEYHGNFVSASGLVGKGLVLYYLDGFPCYGLGEGVRVWLGPNDKHDGELRIACLYPPKEIKFTWRNASRDADEVVSTGMLTCPVDDDARELTINLSECKKTESWKDYK